MSKIDLELIFGDEKEKIDCSNCKHKFQVKLKDVFDGKTKLVCPRCRVDNREKFSPSTKRKLAYISKRSKELEKMLG
ncbi:hypothetical protein [Oceanobacillus locisalsi]|uniref:Uncharacterized protein n=1 Tax=Oceanobacillus locisalsi TaxID=546107 RepID=A0ABW3NI96_9BACI